MGVDGADGFRRSWPHFGQKLLSGGIVLPHFAQAISSFVPHFRQKLSSGPLSVWHFGHFIPNPSYAEYRSEIYKTCMGLVNDFLKEERWVGEGYSVSDPHCNSQPTGSGR